MLTQQNYQIYLKKEKGEKAKLPDDLFKKKKEKKKEEKKERKKKKEGKMCLQKIEVICNWQSGYSQSA